MNSRVMLLLAVLLIVGAGIAGYLGYKTTQDAKVAAQQAAREAEIVKAQAVVVPGKVPVVVAAREIPAYKTITAEDVVLDYIKVEPPFTFRATEDLIGEVLQVPVKPGTLVSQEHLQPGSEIARLLKPGERAVAIAIDEVVGGGGFVQPGDIVDVLLFAQGENRPSASAQIVMRALRVVGFGVQLIGPEGAQTAEAKDGRRAERQRARTAVLAVTEEDVTRLMLASSIGTLRLAIRPASEAIADAELAEAEAQATTTVRLTPAQQAAAAKKKAEEEARLLRASAIVPPSVAERPAASGRPAGPARPAQPPVTIFRGLDRGN